MRRVVGIMLGIAATVSLSAFDAACAAPVNSKSLHTQIQRQLKRNDFAAAKDSAQELVRMEPDSVAAHVWLAKAYSGLKEYKNATEELTAAMKIETDRTTNDRLLYDRAQAEYFGQMYSEAVTDFSKLIAQDATVDLYLQRASAYDGLGKPELAIADYGEAMKLQPSNPDLYLKRALLYKFMQNNDAALADFNKAVKLRPSLVTWRASFYRDQGNSNSAIEDFTSAIENNKGCGKAAELCNRALVYADLDHHRKAIKDLSDAIKIEPERGDFFASRASSYFGVSDFKKAIADFSEAIKRSPENPDYYYKRAEAETSDGQRDLALKDYDEAIRLQKNKKEAALYLYRRGLVSSEMNKHEQALQDLSKAVADDAANSDVWYERGIEYEATEKWKDAEADFTKVISMRPNYAPAFKHRALVRAKAGDTAGALEDLKTSMQLYGDEKDMFGVAEVRRMIAKYSK
jgi:tetratricopeptide (TPR) repeat protein